MPRLVVVLLVVAGGLGVAAPSAQGSCLAPALTLDGPLRPGATVVIRGEHFFDGCGDVGAVDASGCERDIATLPCVPSTMSGPPCGRTGSATFSGRATPTATTA